MSQTLESAYLQRMVRRESTGKNGKATLVQEGDPIRVQFNPTSLRLTYTNNIDRGGVTTLNQRKQNPSAESATLNFDLEFDTAEERTEEGPVDVRTRTADIRQFVEPSPQRPKEPPPLLQFLWGFSFVGIVTQLVEDIDFFSPEGRPLRAKASVTMKEVRLDMEAKTVGNGARTSDNATPPGKPSPASGAPGSAPASNPDRAAMAQAGESVQQLLARLNADPTAWRAAMTGLDNPLSLPAGAQVQLAEGASAGLGLGETAGFAADSAIRTAASLASALGVSESPDVEGGVAASAAAGGGAIGDISAAGGFTSPASTTTAEGFALAEGGGVAASARRVTAERAQASVTAARTAFEVPGARRYVEQPNRPVRHVDPRSQTFGRGIPLRGRIDVADC
jgi:hypothetical protein